MLFTVYVVDLRKEKGAALLSVDSFDSREEALRSSLRIVKGMVDGSVSDTVLISMENSVCSSPVGDIEGVLVRCDDFPMGALAKGVIIERKLIKAISLTGEEPSIDIFVLPGADSEN